MLTSLKRETLETCIEVSLDTEGGDIAVGTGVEMMDSVLSALATSARMGLRIEAKGDLATGDHHTVEDVGIALGSALARLIKKGSGSALIPLGEGVATAAVRFGEPGYLGEFSFRSEVIGGMEMENFGHFMRSLAYNGGFSLYLRARGDDDWRKALAMAEALGYALRAAIKEK